MIVRRTHATLLTAPLLVMLAACSGGGQDGTPGTGDAADPSTDDTTVLMAPAGTINRYGAVTISDDGGNASDLVGSFFRLESGVSSEFLATMFSGDSAMCQVQNDDVIDFEEISAGFNPSIPGVLKLPVSAGQSILIESDTGTYATLDEQPAAGFLFYDLADLSMLPDGPVPAGLRIDIAGSSEIPVFSDAIVPDITTLTGVSPDPLTSIGANTRFTWNRASEPGSMIRIFTSTAGGFFLEDGITVTCVAPDTGEFSFPPTTRALLGSDFSGAPALVSRIRVNTVESNDATLFVIRESFE